MNELQEVRDRLAALETKMDAVFVSAEKTRKYFKATLIVTVLTIVLPGIGLMFAIPFFIKTIGSAYGLDALDPLNGLGN